jgi:hypothetical protein
MFQNPGRYNVGLHNHCFEQTVDIITSATGQLLHEKVFGLFIENATPENFLLIFGSGAAVNLHDPAFHLPLIVDKSLGDEPYWVEPWSYLDWFHLQNVDISNNLTGELYLQNISGIFIYNGLKESIYVFYNGNFTFINKQLPVQIRSPVQFPNEILRRVHLTDGENDLRPFVSNYHYLPQLSAAEYLRWRDRLNHLE